VKTKGIKENNYQKMPETLFIGGQGGPGKNEGLHEDGGRKGPDEWRCSRGGCITPSLGKKR